MSKMLKSFIVLLQIAGMITLLGCDDKNIAKREQLQDVAVWLANPPGRTAPASFDFIIIRYDKTEAKIAAADVERLDRLKQIFSESTVVEPTATMGRPLKVGSIEVVHNGISSEVTIQQSKDASEIYTLAFPNYTGFDSFYMTFRNRQKLLSFLESDKAEN